VIASPPAARRRLVSALAEADTLVEAGADAEALWEQLGSGPVDLVVLHRPTLRELAPATVAEIRALPDRPEVVIVSDREDAEERARLLAAGCLGVVFEALPDEVLGATLRAFAQRRRREAGLAPVEPLARGRFSLGQLVSESPAMQRFLGTARRVVPGDSTLLVLGETGVGKEWLARAIHAESDRARGPFVAVNCGALSESLLESELFGHEKGAFTGATRSRRGYFELAHGGTIFLDEVAELPAHLQVKLLRVLQDHAIQPLGGERSIPVDVRVMAATNRDLEREVRERRFRADLFYRLNVVALTLPPLRERREDIPALVHSYVEEFGRRLNRGLLEVRPDALRALLAYDWPGNVRELANAIERAVLMCEGDAIGPSDLPEAVRGARGPEPQDAQPEVAGEPQEGDEPWESVRRRVVDAAERRYLASLLARAGGRVGEAALRAGLNPRSLYEKMRRHGLRKEDFRARPPRRREAHAGSRPPRSEP
jgi:DNA-binding NtrC family response regulator